MKKEKKEGYINFVSLGDRRDCTEDSFIFNILAGSMEIEEGSGFTLELVSPNYASAYCQIEEDEIICSININIYPLDDLDIKLPDDISLMLPYEYDGWEKVLRVVRLQQYCMPKYIAQFIPSDNKTCNKSQFRELTIPGILNMDIPTDLKSKYDLYCAYIKDEFHQSDHKGYDNCTLIIKNKINYTSANAEIIYKLEANYNARFYPIIASNINKEDFYINTFKKYNLTEVCNKTKSNGKMLFLNKYLFILLLFLF